MRWSDGRINKIASGSISRDFRDAIAIAGQVFLPKGSRIIDLGFIFISLNCSP